MKKFTFAILSLLLAATCFAKEVTQSEAVEVAQRMMKQKNVSVTQVSLVTPVVFNGKRAYYAVQFQSGGWVLVSADDVVAPVIGYSENGSFPVLNMPDNMRGWLDLGAEQANELKKLTNKRNSAWDKAEVLPMAASDKVSPLIKVQWNQTSPYNAYCPSKNGSSRAVVGCVAVGMAQAMSVARYPERPEGKVSYNSSVYGSIVCDFSKEPAYNWSEIISGENNKDGAARLLWHCGAATKMDYSPSGSGTQTSYVASALKNYFGYSKSVTYISRSDYSDKEWNSTILSELKEGRPIVYCGFPSDGTAGHCFNLDGYNGTFYHVNWGWGGAGDAYFSLDNLAAQVVVGGDVMAFTEGHGMVIGIKAPNEDPIDITLSNTSVAINQPVGTVVATVTVDSEAKDPKYSYKVQGPYSVILKKNLPVPFDVKDGNLVTTEVITLDDKYLSKDPFTGASAYEVNITATNDATGKSCSKKFSITVKNSSGVNDVVFDENAPVEYFNLQGIKVSNPGNGIYIKRQGTKAEKVILR